MNLALERSLLVEGRQGWDLAFLGAVSEAGLGQVAGVGLGFLGAQGLSFSPHQASYPWWICGASYTGASCSSSWGRCPSNQVNHFNSWVQIQFTL